MVVCLKQEAAILSLFDISEVTQKNLTIQGHIAKNCFNFFLHITPLPPLIKSHTAVGFWKVFSNDILQYADFQSSGPFLFLTM